MNLRSVKVVINGLSARRGGAVVFLLNLLSELVKNENAFITLFYDASIDKDISAFRHKNIRLIKIEIKGPVNRFITEHCLIPFHCKKNKTDCLFQVDDSLSPVSVLLGIKTMVLFHASIQFYSGTELGDHWLKIVYWKIMKQFALKYSTVAVTVSFCAKAELARGSKALLKKIQVIYHGIDHNIFNNRKVSEVSPLPYKYILSVSNRNPHKNFPSLLIAYSELIKKANVEEHLLLIGAAVLQKEETLITQIINENCLRERVHFIESTPNQQLAKYYQHATAYVYTSIFDSFGLTPIEAMACGTPTCVSFYSALPETCGDAPLYFEPTRIESIKDALLRIVQDEHLRDEKKQIGLAHARRFLWQSTVSQYVRLINEIVNE